MTLPQKSILVTGASGFIGRHLVPALVSAGHRVTAIVRDAATGGVFGPGARISVIPELAGIDPRDQRLQGYDAIIHLAGRAHKSGERGDFEVSNIKLTERLARACACAGISRFILVSSIGAARIENLIASGVGEAELWQTRPYQMSKYKAEQALRMATIGTSMETVVLRPPLVYAADAPGNMAMLLKILRKGWPLPLASLCKNRRAFLALPHFIEAVKICLVHPAAANRLYELADNEQPSTADFIRMSAAGLGISARLWPCPLWLLRKMMGLLGRPMLVESLLDDLFIDSAPIMRETGWRPSQPMGEALRLALSSGISSSPVSTG